MPRVNKYLSEIGFCSRREADKLIKEGRVHLNNRVVESGDSYHSGDELTVDFENVVPKKKEKALYLAFNKPKRIVCTTDTKAEKDNIIDFIGHPQRIFPIGRLDKLSEGLILLTNDGDIVNKILRAENEHEKEYEVTVNKEITPSFVKRMSNGLPILGTKTKRCKVTPLSDTSFRIILTQGLNRQIRRMCEFLGYKVTSLKRIRIMHIPLNVASGTWRELNKTELAMLFEKLKDSNKTESSNEHVQTKKNANNRSRTIKTAVKSTSRGATQSKKNNRSFKRNASTKKTSKKR